MSSTVDRVLMIAVDAAEASRIERLLDDGRLPALARLRERGAWGRLASPAAALNAAAWPSFVTGRGPAAHGVWNFLSWDPVRLDYERAALPAGVEPFWRRLRGRDLRVIALDVPFAAPPAREVRGLELHGWAAHYRLTGTFASPAARLGPLLDEFGPSPLPAYAPGLLPARAYLRLRDQLVAATEASSRLACTLLRREPWNLCVLGLAAPHVAGHQLWDDSNLRGRPTGTDARELSGALDAVYEACDRAVGALVEAAGPGCACLVFALHGMGPNHSLSELLPEMLRRVLAGGPVSSGAGAGRGFAARLREALPAEWRSAVKNRLPERLQDRLTLFWRERNPRWDSTTAFCLLPDVEGFVRINLAGRERHGIVSPGRELDELRALVQRGLQTFVEADTEAPVVRRVARIEDVVPDAEPEIRERLPDLAVYWEELPVAELRAVRSPLYGEIPWPHPGRAGDGQSGHHRATGWLIATAPGLEPGTTLDGARVLDLPATALALLGTRIPEDLEGAPLAGARVEALA